MSNQTNDAPVLSAEESNPRKPFDPQLAPNKIWLQISDEALDYIRPENIEWSEVTWCREVVNVHDVEYVRADLLSVEGVVNEQLAKWEEAFLACQEQWGKQLGTINKPLALTAAFCLMSIGKEDSEEEVAKMRATLDAETRRADAAEKAALETNDALINEQFGNDALKDRIAELEALQPDLVAVAGDMEALEKCEDCGDKKANSAQWHDGDEADPFVGHICSTCGCHTWVTATLDEVLAEAQRRNAE